MSSDATTRRSELDTSRKEILEGLNESARTLVTSPSILDRPDMVEWSEKLVQKAISDLTFFWRYTHFYSTNNLPEYLDVVMYRFTVDDNGTFKFDRVHVTSVEELYGLTRDFAKTNLPEGQQGLQLLCSCSGGIHPPPDPKNNKARKRLWRDVMTRFSDPTGGDICKSALTAALTLLYQKTVISSEDLLALLGAFVSSPAGDLTPLLPDILEDHVGVHLSSPGSQVIPPVVYTTLKTPIACLIRQNSLSTKTIRFPGKLPIISNGPFYKDMWRRHGELPDANYRAALWGAFKNDARSWASIAVFANPAVNQTLDKNLSFTLSAYHAEMHEIASHWNHLLRYIYAIGINDIRLSLRNNMQQLEKLRYSNISEPSIDFATTCAMYMSHLQYYRRLVSILNKELTEFPATWNLDGATLSSLDWVGGTEEGLKIAEKELLQVYDEIGKIREMASLQHSLVQARKGVILTVLASIFIPMSFVATFFGMNTKEINSSAWPLKYYFAVACPLAFLTVLVPLYFVKVVAFFARQAQQRSGLFQLLSEFLFALSFVCNFVSDILGIIGIQTYVVGFVLVFYFAISTSIFLYRIISVSRNYFRTRRTLIIVFRDLWRLRLDVTKFCVLITFLISCYFVPWVEIPFYLLYYCFKFLDWRKSRKTP